VNASFLVRGQNDAQHRHGGIVEFYPHLRWPVVT
jgi:hypothetical protein